MEEQKTPSKISVPIAIVVAGGLIALAVFMTGSSGNKASNQDDPDASAGNIYDAVSMKPIIPENKILGNPNAPITLVEFSDVDCPFCKTIHNTLKDIMETYGKEGKISVVFKHFPLEQLHPEAPYKHLAVECVHSLGGNDATWKFLDELFSVNPQNTSNDPTLLSGMATRSGVSESGFDSCMSSGELMGIVEAEYNEAITAGGSGTPYSVFLLKEAMTATQIQRLETIASELPPGIIGISADKTKVTMSGALPYALIERIIKAVE